jgi:predicted DNA binding protein
VRQYALLDRDGRTCRYKIVPAAGMVEQLADVVEDPTELRSLAANESVVEGIRVTSDGWVQTRWFAGRDAFDEYRSFWNGNGVSLSVRRLSRTDVDAGSERQLTDRQREALVTAYEMGYFEIPRTTSLAEVADELDISAPALSERLRRAHARVTEALVAAGGELNDLTE